MKKHTKPEGFEDFALREVRAPNAEWMRFYDIPNKIIWINTAAEEANNVVKLEPKKW